MTQLSDKLTFKHGATVNNRFFQAPMLTNSGDMGFATEDTINYYAARSKAGGMIITEYHYVSENGGPAQSWRRGREQLAVFDDKFIPQLKKVATALKKDGNKAILQIAHTGREANVRAMEDKPVYAPSAIDYHFLPYKVHELSDEQVKEIIDDFGQAVRRAVEAGFDGVEIHGANHYLIQQFFSQYSNRREDHWGGSLEKRMNFPLAVVKSVTDAVKKYAPSDFIVGYRISPEEIHGQNVGYTWHDSYKLLEAITSQYDLDYVHFSLTNYAAKPGDPMLVDREVSAENFHDSDKSLAELLKPALQNNTALLLTGGVRDRKAAEGALAIGGDMVGVGRENIVDPLFAEKILAGKDDEVITTLSAKQAKEAKLTQGLIDVYSTKGPQPIPVEVDDSIYDLHEGFGGWTEMKYPDNSQMK